MSALVLVGLCAGPAGSAAVKAVGCTDGGAGPAVRQSREVQPGPFSPAGAGTAPCRTPLGVLPADGGLSRRSQGTGTKSGTVGARSDLRALQGIRSSRVAPGETFRYTITVFNRGPSAARDVVVTDRLPKALSFVSSNDGCTAVGRAVPCGPAAIASGTSRRWVSRHGRCNE